MGGNESRGSSGCSQQKHAISTRTHGTVTEKRNHSFHGCSSCVQHQTVHWEAAAAEKNIKTPISNITLAPSSVSTENRWEQQINHKKLEKWCFCCNFFFFFNHWYTNTQASSDAAQQTASESTASSNTRVYNHGTVVWSFFDLNKAFKASFHI